MTDRLGSIITILRPTQIGIETRASKGVCAVYVRVHFVKKTRIYVSSFAKREKAAKRSHLVGKPCSGTEQGGYNTTQEQQGSPAFGRVLRGPKQWRKLLRLSVTLPFGHRMFEHIHSANPTKTNTNTTSKTKRHQHDRPVERSRSERNTVASSRGRIFIRLDTIGPCQASSQS